MPVFQRLLRGWRAQGHALVTLGALRAALDDATVPRRRPARGELPGRSGLVAMPGAVFAAG